MAQLLKSRQVRGVPVLSLDWGKCLIRSMNSGERDRAGIRTLHYRDHRLLILLALFSSL